MLRMRGTAKRMLIATVLLLTLSLRLDAGHWRDREPRRAANYVGRCLGLGWSDGYHAVGSRNSWSPAHGKVTRYPVQPWTWHQPMMAVPGQPPFMPPTAAPQIQLPTPAELPLPLPAPIPDDR
jgi:hypothetical protein